MFYTYVLLSEKDRKYYIGLTNALKRRFDEHKKGLVPATKHRLPLQLVYYEACVNEKDSIKREKYFKSGYGRRFLNNRIEEYMKDIK
jgi:putative endonuclease